MAFAAEVQDFISAFSAMNQALGTKSSREAERSRTDYTNALTAKTRWDMGESDRDAAGLLGYADDRYGSIELSGGEGGDIIGSGGGGPIVIDGVTIEGDFKGLNPSLNPVLTGMARGAKQAGLDRIVLTGGYEGGHKSHLSAHDMDFKGYQGNTLWNPEQRVAVARGGAAGGADRFGLYSFGEGYTGNGSLHIGKSGAPNPRSGSRTPSAVWGYKGMTGGEASRAFTDPYERAFLRKFNARDLAAMSGGGGADTALGGAGTDVMGAIEERSGPREYPYRQAAGGTGGDIRKFRDAIASAESRGSGDYSAVNESSGALGRYQVMPANIPSWTKAALGRSVTPEQFLADPAIQDAVFDKIFGDNLAKHNARDAISIWFTGRPEAVAGANESDGAMQNKDYIDKIMGALGGGFGSGVAPTPPPQFDEMQGILEAGGQELLPEFGAPPLEEAQTKDDELDLDVIRSQPDSKIPWYNRGAFGSDAYAEMSDMQAIQEAIATSPIMAPTNAATPTSLTPPYPSPAAAALAEARTKDELIIPGGGRVKDDAIPGVPEVAGGTDVLGGTNRTGLAAGPTTVSALLGAPVPDPNMRPATTALPGTEAVADVPEPPVRPDAAIPEQAAGMGFDPLPQTSGYMDPVSRAGHDSLVPGRETLTNSIRGTGNRRRQPFKGLLGRIFNGGRQMLGVPDEAVEVDDDDPRKDAFLGGVGGLNAELIDQVEDRVRAGSPNMSEEQVKMEVLSTLWNYFNEQGQPDKADKVAFAAMQSYKQISQRYLAIAQSALEDGKMDEAVDNYRAAYGMIPDGDTVDVTQMPDGNYQVTIADTDTGAQQKVIIKTPDQIAADIMDTTPEIFDNLIKKKIAGADSEPSAAEIAAKEEADWFAGGGLPAGAPAPETAIPEVATGGVTGSPGDDMLEEAVPTEVAAADVTSDVTLGGGSDGAEAIPMSTPASAPNVPMSFDEFNSYLSTIPPGARGAATTLWKLQQASYDKYQKTQPTPEDIAVQQNVNQFFTDLANAPAGEVYYPNEALFIGVGTETGNLMLRAATERNAQLGKDMTSAKESRQQEALAYGLDQTRETPNVPPSPVPASSPIMGGERTGTITNLEPVVPGKVTAEQLARPLNTAEMPRPKGDVGIDPVLAANMSDSGRTSYMTAVGDRNEANDEFDKGFEPQPVDMSKLSDPTGSGETRPLQQVFVGDLMSTDPAAPQGLLGDYIAYNGVEGASEDNRANAVMLQDASKKYPSMRGDIAQAAAAVLQAPQNPATAMNEQIAFSNVMNMLWVPKSNPMAVTYQAYPMPDQPGMVQVGFATSPPTTVIMPAQTYNRMDQWRSMLQADLLNGAYDDAIAAGVTADENTAASQAVQADIDAQAERERGTLPPAQGGGLIPSGPSLMELDMAIPEDER